MSIQEKENPHSGHRQRMRERFLKTGFNGFSEHQILELLLFYTCPRVDTNVLAHTLIDKFGSVTRVINASVDDLVTVKGISSNTAVLFKLIPEVLKHYYINNLDRDAFATTGKLKEFFVPFYVGVAWEEIRLVCLDNSLGLLENIVLAKGSPSESVIDMRDLAKIVINAHATYVVLAHNHPLGSPAPSAEDVLCTKQVYSFLKSIGVTLLDHIIVGKDETLSMQENGNLKLFT